MKKGTKSKPSKAIDSQEMVLAMAELEKENGMEEGSLLESIEAALVIAYKKDYDSTADNVTGTVAVTTSAPVAEEVFKKAIVDADYEFVGCTEK